ncbi:MAG: helix-turn-helix transcriptional regulator [Hyphomicrobiales bacterium]
METHDRFVQAIREKLARENLSVRAAALRANLPVRSIQAIMEGHVPSIERAAEIAKALGICFHIGAPEGEAPASSADPELIGLLTERIVKAYEDGVVKITPRRAAELAAVAHNRVVDETEDRNDRLLRIGEYIAELRYKLSDKTG